MNRLLTRALFLIAFSAVLVNCRKKAFDDYYGRPDSLPSPIYQQLTARGNFKSLLAIIDKGGYKDILSGAGSFTMFAPNDAAFQKFFTARGISGVAQVDSGTAKQIVTFSLVYNAFMKARLGDYQATTGWVPNQAFRRRTANYRGFYNDTSYTGQAYVAIANNRNTNFVFGDNNNKYTTYFVDNYFSNRGLTAADYNYFYPSSTYSGFNVADASVVTRDIVAENGYIDEIDKVVLPQPTIDQYLASNPQYSEFKKLFDKYMVSFLLNNDATTRYKLLTGLSANVYIKQFNPLLGFSPNNENYLKLQDNDGQTNGYTLFVPRNDVLLAYINSVLLENYPSLDVIPTQIIVDFINAHMWQSSVWPSQFAVSNNVQGEPAKFNSASDIIDKQVLSNGFFYGTSKVQQSNIFSTVYARPYLDPKYLIMTRALDLNYRFTITIPTLKFTLVMMSDSALRAKGFDWSSTHNDWQYTTPGTTTVTYGTTARDLLLRVLATHIVPTPNNDLDNISGAGIIETLNGEYIKYNAGNFISAGDQDSGFVVHTNNTKTSTNGRVYYGDNLLMYSVKPLANSIISLGGTSAATSQFYNFAQYLKNSSLYNPTTGSILGVSLGVLYTAFIPNNASVQAAVTAGLLPNTGGLPNFTPSVVADQLLVNNFILYHLLNKTTVIPDGKKIGTFESVYKKLSGDAGQLIVNSTPGSMQVTDSYGRVANVVIGSSNNLADRCIIHLIDNYLQYNPN